MNEKIIRNRRDSVSVSNMERMLKIRELLATGLYTKITPIKEDIKGSSYMYTLFTQHNLILAGPNGILSWNEKVPITYKLAQTLTDELRAFNRGNVERQEKAVLSEPSVPSVPKTPEEPFQLDIETPVANVKFKRKRKINAVVEEDKEKPGLTVSFAWGLFKYIRN